MLRFQNATAREEEFLYRLYALTRQNEFSVLGLPEEQLDALLRNQYGAQNVSYQCQFPSANHQIVMLEQVPIGRIMVKVSDQAVRLVDISLLPEYRGKGIGTILLKQVQHLAARLGLPVKLHVLYGNPAQRLYARCGFYMTEEKLPFHSMQWDKI